MPPSRRFLREAVSMTLIWVMPSLNHAPEGYNHVCDRTWPCFLPVVPQGLYIKAKRPEAALKMYRDARMWNDALRVAEQYLPTKVGEVQMELMSGSSAAASGGGAGAGVDGIISKARAFERNNDYARAIETYLSLGANVRAGSLLVPAVLLALIVPCNMNLRYTYPTRSMSRATACSLVWFLVYSTC